MKRWLVQRRLVPLLAAAALGLAPLPAQAQSVENVPTSVQLSVDQERQAERTGMKIHCPICSGESVAQSQTDISRQMMNQVRQMVAQGKPESEILDTFRASYGDRILLEPPKRGLDLLLWVLPVAFLLIGGAVWWSYLQRASRLPAHALSAEEERRIEDMMAGRK